METLAEPGADPVRVFESAAAEEGPGEELGTGHEAGRRRSRSPRGPRVRGGTAFTMTGQRRAHRADQRGPRVTGNGRGHGRRKAESERQITDPSRRVESVCAHRVVVLPNPVGGAHRREVRSDMTRGFRHEPRRENPCRFCAASRREPPRRCAQARRLPAPSRAARLTESSARRALRVDRTCRTQPSSSRIPWRSRAPWRSRKTSRWLPVMRKKRR